MYEFYAKENYMPEELKEAKESMSLDEAYNILTEYYRDVSNTYSSIREQEKMPLALYEVPRIRQALSEKTKRYSSELREKDGFDKYLGMQLIPTEDVEYGKKLRKACILVDNEYRNGGGEEYFITLFGEYLPQSFIGMVFLNAIQERDEEMLQAIKRCDMGLFNYLDTLLGEVQPETRLQALHQEDGFYASVLISSVTDEIVASKDVEKYKEALDFYESLPQAIRESHAVNQAIQFCLYQARFNCNDINIYMDVKKALFNRVYNISRENGEQLDKTLESILEQVGYSKEFAELCPFDLVADRFMDLLFLSTDKNGKTSSEYSELMNRYAELLLQIDIDEQNKCKSISIDSHGEINQEVKRTATQSTLLKYQVHDMIRDNIDSVQKAVSYMKMFNFPGYRYSAPDKEIMQIILSRYGNVPEIKEILFEGCSGTNLLWDVIPFDSLPEEYSTYEKMMAGTQILSIDINRDDEIPKEIRDRIFSSKDCIIRILFPGLEYKYENYEVFRNSYIGRYDKNVSGNALLVGILRRLSPKLKNKEFTDELDALINMYLASNPEARSSRNY